MESSNRRHFKFKGLETSISVVAAALGSQALDLDWSSRHVRNVPWVFSVDGVQSMQARSHHLPDTCRLIYEEWVTHRKLNRESGAAEDDECSCRSVERTSDVDGLDSCTQDNGLQDFGQRRDRTRCSNVHTFAAQAVLASLTCS